MNIGQIKVTKEWTSVETLVKEQIKSDFSFNSAKRYQMQVKGQNSIIIDEFLIVPENDSVVGNQCFNNANIEYKVDTINNTKLYVRSADNSVIGINIDELEA